MSLPMPRCICHGWGALLLLLPPLMITVVAQQRSVPRQHVSAVAGEESLLRGGYGQSESPQRGALRSRRVVQLAATTRPAAVGLNPRQSPAAAEETIRPMTEEKGIQPASSTSMTMCRWTVFAGDSNMRGIVAALEARAKTSRGQTLLHVTSSASWSFELSHAVRQGRRGDAKYCADTRWEDKEWVVRGGGLQGGSADGVVGSGGSDQQCHLVTLRFLRAQTEIIRLVGNISDGLYCGTEISSPLLATERRPAFPEVIWFGHGLWGLPNDGVLPQNDPNLDCAAHFQVIAATLSYWTERKSHTRVYWQTNFEINHHSSVTNAYLRAEVACQRQQAKLHGLRLFDLFQLVQSQSGGYQRVVTDYHLSLPMQEMVAGIIEEKLARIEEVEDPSPGPDTNLHTIQAAADRNLHIAQDQAKLQCVDRGGSQNYCSAWCNTPGRWGCGPATDGRYTCDCTGCNGCTKL